MNQAPLASFYTKTKTRKLNCRESLCYYKYFVELGLWTWKRKHWKKRLEKQKSCVKLKMSSGTLSSATTSSAVTTPSEDPSKHLNAVDAEMELVKIFLVCCLCPSEDIQKSILKDS